jgi:hypothetical protein
LKIENLYLTFVVQQQQDRMSEYNEEKQQMADLLSALFKTLAGNSTSGTEKCFTCGERMDEEEGEDNGVRNVPKKMSGVALSATKYKKIENIAKIVMVKVSVRIVVKD